MTALLLQRPAAAVIAALALLAAPVCIAQSSYVQTNLVSDISGLATHTDPNLVNPWGIATSNTSPFWISDNHTGVSTLYDSNGNPFSLVVTIPPAPGSLPPGSPTGVVFNGTTDFPVNGAAARFIFATEGGTIAGWNGGTSAVVEVNNSGSAVYKGLALGNNGSGNFLYAANFHAGTVDVFDAQFMPAMVAGHFIDPNLPSGYAPFNIQNININGTDRLLVTFAQQDADKEDDVAGAGHGFVDVFDLNGNLIKRLITDGVLNSPWGLAIAPPLFGAFSNDLLVGNFGDGRINAFDPTTGNFLGTLRDGNGPITIDGLWGLRVGNGGFGGDPNSVFFTAGIPGPGGQVEDHGLFGRISVPDSGTSFTLMLVSLAGLVACARKLGGVIAAR